MTSIRVIHCSFYCIALLWIKHPPSDSSTVIMTSWRLGGDIQISNFTFSKSITTHLHPPNLSIKLLYPDALRLITGRQNWHGMRCLHGFGRRLAHATLIDPWVPFTVHRSPQRLLYNRASTGFLRGSCRSTTWVDMELA